MNDGKRECDAIGCDASKLRSKDGDQMKNTEG